MAQARQSQAPTPQHGYELGVGHKAGTQPGVSPQNPEPKSRPGGLCLILRSQTVEILLNSLIIAVPVGDQGHRGRLALIGTQRHPFALLGVCSVVMTSPGDLGGTFDTHDVRTGLVLGGESQGGEYPQQPSPPHKGKT